MKDVIEWAESWVSRTLFKITLKSKKIKSLFFQVERIVVFLKALLLNLLKAARNSILIKISWLVWITSLTTFCYEHAWIDQSSDLTLINLIRASHDAMSSLNLAHLCWTLLRAYQGWLELANDLAEIWPRYGPTPFYFPNILFLHQHLVHLHHLLFVLQTHLFRA